MSKPLDILRPQAEVAFAEELKALKEAESGQVPTGWEISPRSVVTYILGGELPSGHQISPKYYGERKLIELAVATLLTDRALLLIGVPGTAKTWLAEHLSAAISGQSTLLVQGTAGLPEEALRYGWNYARLLSEGPTDQALVASPIMKAMQEGKVARVEELTRIPAEVQDSLITLLSEKILPIPELNREVHARRGFNLIATANDRDKGINELSSALRRRFNTVVMPLPKTLEEEVSIVQARVEQTGKSLDLPVPKDMTAEVRRLVTIFRELRSGQTADGNQKLKTPSSTLSTAEAISVMHHGLALAAHFGEGEVKPADLAAGITGAIIKDATQDKAVWTEYLEVVMRSREDWAEWYEACKAFL
jgi:MoxR-like ATPase